MLRLTEEEYLRYIKKLSPAETHNFLKKNKYRNVKVYVYEDGFVSYGEKSNQHGKLLYLYDSIKEYKRSKELELLQRAGEISELERQKRLLIKDGFVNREGKKIRAVGYNADFFYREKSGQYVVEDVKGFSTRTQKYQTTAAFDLKWKLLQAKYPNYLFRLY